MIDEVYPMFCVRGLSRWPAIGNARGRQFDLYRARVGTPINFAKIFENWATDSNSLELTDTDLNSAGASLLTFPIAIGRFISNKAVFYLRAGNVDDPITVFRTTRFIIYSNGSEKYRFLGWEEVPREFYWRLDGGEKIDLVIYDPTGINLPEESFIYADLTIHYEPKALILEQEMGDVNVNLLPKNGRRL